MRLLSSLLLLMATVTTIYAQEKYDLVEIDVKEFGSYEAFSKSASPHITGRGPLSDSLSHSNMVFDYYEAKGKYYPIESWADYFYWMSKKYAFLFNQPDVFEHFYEQKDNVQMIKYLSINFSVWHFPSTIRIKPHSELPSHMNRFSNLFHLVANEKDKDYMINQIDYKKKLMANKD
ncbi:hypothetical protein KMW28_16865 [Flammeovirga yaeyamensis]|uniref:Uncharacterized protein n=1 Tax=Flammeovirga yaeyamensis TaxID=367791 RepID=A0AAX1N183_9BACT|nr:MULTISPECIES: hypothetical protein [Flammeovirga]ANQ51256.1 hypothetical protein MY04_3912 [Flammeovirga sp. MY04]MBB3698313.1 hypothetical protein [Flammeovirga yaeyamensis]NMF34334.1 hypothetical protein [Flammeovirga yaeyamensis]QWG01315.1 hypothetical protein KMW28_16865 [Flammeovirga yaeyamensis]